MVYFNKMTKVAVPAIFALGCFAVLAACGSDSSADSSPKTSTEELSFETFDDLPNCTKNSEGKTAFIEEDGQQYVCQDGEWKEESEVVAEYETEDDLPNCSKNREKEVVKLKDTDSFMVCKGGAWVEYVEEEDDESDSTSNEKESSSSSDDGKKDESSSSDDGKKDESSSSDKSVGSSSSEFQWEDDCADSGEGCQSSSSEKSSSSTKKKEVEFEEGVLWKPSYGNRVHVFGDSLNEYNFHSDESRTGKWFLNTDRTGDVPGVSTADTTYGKNYMTITHNLAYQNWTRKDGVISPDPNPYAQALIYFSPKNTTADLSAYKGICLEYSSTKEFRLEFQSQGDGEDDFWDVWVPGGEHTVNLEFKNIPVAFWRSSNSVSIGQALKKMILMNIESPYIDNTQCYATNSNDCEDKTVTNTIKLYKIGEYGKCSGEAVELGKKRVVFEENVLWKSSYENKVRTFFGAVDEYNFMTDDVSGWWFTYSDTSSTTDNGQSTVRKTLKSSGGYLEINLSLVYDRWKMNGTNIVPSPYPYAAFGFNWTSANEDGFADLSLLGEGLCLDYTAEKGFDMILYVYQDQDRWQTTIPASSVRKVINVKFGDAADMGDFFRYDWQSGTGLPFETIVKQVTGLHFEMNGQHAGSYVDWCTEDDLDAGLCEKQTVTNTIKLYKLGKYGACD